MRAIPDLALRRPFELDLQHCPNGSGERRNIASIMEPPLANAITGITGDNLLDGAEGDDTLADGTDDDLYITKNAGDVMIATAGNDTVRTARNGCQMLDGFENLELAGAAQSASDKSADNRIKGTAGNNTLVGGLVNDTLEGGQGDDVVDVSAGDDAYLIDSLLDKVSDRGRFNSLVSSVDDYAVGLDFKRLQLSRNALIGVGNSADNLDARCCTAALL